MFVSIRGWGLALVAVVVAQVVSGSAVGQCRGGGGQGGRGGGQGPQAFIAMQRGMIPQGVGFRGQTGSMDQYGPLAQQLAWQQSLMQNAYLQQLQQQSAFTQQMAMRRMQERQAAKERTLAQTKARREQKEANRRLDRQAAAKESRDASVDGAAAVAISNPGVAIPGK